MRVLMTGVMGVLAILFAHVASVAAAGSLPSATKVLFETVHLNKLEAGSKLSYRLEQTISNEKLLGPPIKDDITVAIARVSSNGKRDVKVSIFTGERARPVQSITGLTGNPLLVIFLDRAVRNYHRVAGGKIVYLKNRFKIELAKHAKVKATKVSYNGKEVDGYRVSVEPFVRDPSRYKMHGYEGSTFSFVVSKDIPGYFWKLDSVLESPKEMAPRIEEHIRFASVGGVK